MASGTFQEQLAFGMVGEGMIATWLKRRCGYSVLPAYEKEVDNGKGPRMFAPDRNIVTPDMLAIRGDVVKWIEAKRKTVFTWYRTGKPAGWTTGIDRHHYREYLDIASRTPWKVYLFFLQESSTPSADDIKGGCDPTCPTGLFCGELSYLAANISHENGQWGKHGMVYWRDVVLTHLATVEEVRACGKEHRDAATAALKEKYGDDPFLTGKSKDEPEEEPWE